MTTHSAVIDALPDAFTATWHQLLRTALIGPPLSTGSGPVRRRDPLGVA